MRKKHDKAAPQEIDSKVYLVCALSWFFKIYAMLCAPVRVVNSTSVNQNTKVTDASISPRLVGLCVSVGGSTSGVGASGLAFLLFLLLLEDLGQLPRADGAQEEEGANHQKDRREETPGVLDGEQRPLQYKRRNASDKLIFHYAYRRAAAHACSLAHLITLFGIRTHGLQTGTQTLNVVAKRITVWTDTNIPYWIPNTIGRCRLYTDS